LSIESPNATIQASLSRAATFTFLPWTRLDDVVGHWQRETGVTMLVDWRQLADVELLPSSPIACSAADRPWHEALDKILEELGLVWLAVDGQTIQITTGIAGEACQRTEFYRVPRALRAKFAGDQALIDALQAELQDHAGDNAAAVNSVVMQLDGPSGRLIVRGTPLVHRALAQQFSGDANQSE
jgi:hypothetical protein